MVDIVNFVVKSCYCKVEVCIWGDEKFCELLFMFFSGQGFWLFLIIGLYIGFIFGLFWVGCVVMVEEFGWELEVFDKVFWEVFQ